MKGQWPLSNIKPKLEVNGIKKPSHWLNVKVKVKRSEVLFMQLNQFYNVFFLSSKTVFYRVK